jgi:hypothetical protein
LYDAMKPLIQEDTAANTISRALRSQKGIAKLWLKKYNEAMTSNKTIDSKFKYSKPTTNKR